MGLLKKSAKVINEYLKEQSNLNDNFWKWFGNSKIVKSNVPIVLFHGTKNNLTSFDERKKGTSTDYGIRGRGFYFSDNILSAKSYGNNLYEVYLKIEKPFDLLSFNSLSDIVDTLGIDESIIQERGRGTNYHSITIKASYSGVFSSAVRSIGYDGIIHGQEYVCFNPNQIKSIENDGTWDIDDDNIFS
jgi:hypothetical protein